MTNLLAPYSLGQKLSLKNRLVMAPMTTWSANDDLTISDQEVAYYEARNQGVGLIVTGCTHVQKNGISFTNEFAGYDDAYLDSLKKLAATAKSKEAPAILQLNHGGNKALPELAQDVVSASPVPTQATAFAPSLTPRALTDQEIREVIKDFGRAAQRALAAGFDGVELHGAHGFLIQQFLSPYFNQRTDEWGGSLVNRMRFALEIVREIKTVMAASDKPDFILGYRLSPDEPVADGLKVADTLALVDELIALGVDYIHTSLMVAHKTTAPETDETYLELFAQKIAGRTSLIAAGGVQTAEQAQAVLAQGADLVAVAHGLITDPLWVEKVTAGERPDHTIKRSNLDQLSLPDKLWAQLQAMGDWFQIED